MKKILALWFLLLACALYAQEDAWVYFKNKPNADFYFSNPLEMLSQRALDRRAAHGIPLNMYDIPIHQDYIDEVAGTGVLVMAKSKWLNAVHVRGTVDNIQLAAQLPFVEEVRFADRNLNATGRPASVSPSRRSAAQQVTFPYGASGNQITMLNGHLLHESNYTGQGKVIAVLDAGFPGVNTVPAFQRIRDNNQILGGYNFVSGTEDVYSLNSHGTMVLSTMAGYVPNQLVGTAPDAGYLLYVTEDAASENPVEESYWVEAAEEADRMGADIINTSLGYFGYDDPDYNYTYEDLNGETSFISRGANIASMLGLVVVVSAGNSGSSFNPFIGVPADAPGAFTIGAVDAAGNYAPFSSIGPTADARIKPDVMAKGVAATVCTPSGNITTANGTSFSGPIIAGMMASFWSAVPSMSSTELIQYVRASSHLSEMPNDQMGYGIPDFSSALFQALSINNFQTPAVRICPNPVQSSFAVDLPEGTFRAHLRIYNNLGQFAFESTVDDGSPVDVSALPTGVYSYQLVSDDAHFSGRLIKQ